MIRVIGDKLQHCFYRASGRLRVQTPRNIHKNSDHAYDPVDVSYSRSSIYVEERTQRRFQKVGSTVSVSLQTCGIKGGFRHTLLKTKLIFGYPSRAISHAGCIQY